MHEVLEKLRRELSGGVDGLSAEGTQGRRGPEKWTIQQIVEHLLLSYKTTGEVAGVRVAKGTPTKAKPSPAQRIGQFGLITCGIFPKGRLAPSAVSPEHAPTRTMTGEELSGLVAESLGRMDEALAKAEALFGPSRRAISHMVLGPMSVSQWRRFHLIHGEHHLKQIVATRAMLPAVERLGVHFAYPGSHPFLRARLVN